jgi:ribosomal protein S18 acetylase RimI-like enzyme
LSEAKPIMPAVRGRQRVTNEVIIRPADAGDADIVHRITADAYRRYEDEIGIVPLPAREDHRPRIERGEVWLLMSRDECVGLAVIETKPDHLLLYSIAVRPDRQGEAHARRLLAFLDERTAAQGLAEVRLYTNALMHRNLAIYRRWGFVEIGRRSHSSREGHFVVDMAKRIGRDTHTRQPK